MTLCSSCNDALCEFQGCYNKAEWEGWYRVPRSDSWLTGEKSGLIRKVQVCDEHTYILIAAEKERTEEALVREMLVSPFDLPVSKEV